MTTQLSYTKYVLTDIIEEALDPVREDMMARKLGFELEIQENLPSTFLGDRITLQKTLNHLIYNAVARTQKGLISVYISDADTTPKVYHAEDKINLSFSLCDTGEGFKTSEINSVLSKYRDLQINVDNVKGLGSRVDFVLEVSCVNPEPATDVVKIVSELAWHSADTKKNVPEEEYYIETSRVETLDKANKAVSGNKNQQVILEKTEEVALSADTQLPALPDFNWPAAVGRLGSEEITLMVAKELYAGLPTDINETTQLYDALIATVEREGQDPEVMTKAYTNYRIKVHAIKGTLATVGAEDMSHIAKMLEYAARDEKLARIKQMQPVLIEELNRAIKDWQVFAPEQVSRPNCSDLNQLADQLTALMEAADVMDIDACDTIMDDINKCVYEGRTANIIKALDEAVRNLNDDAIKKLCSKILEEI